MRNIFLGLLAVVMFASVLPAQDSVTIPRAQLTAEQLKTLPSSIASDGKWAGAGKEVGIAVNSALSAVTEQAGKFGETKVGKLTMGIVIWKVLGKDLLGLVWALIIVTFGIPIIVWSYRRYLPQRVLVKESGSIFKGNKEREWKVEDPAETSGYSNEGVWVARLIHAIALLVVLAAGSCAIFGGPK